MTETKTREKKPKVAELEWRALRPKEMEATLPNGGKAYIKQDVGKLGALDSFWYCYHTIPGEGRRYCGTEKNTELAKARAVSGRMRMAAQDLGEWLERVKDTIPEDLYAAELKRYEEWKKNPQKTVVAEPPIETKSPRSTGGSAKQTLAKGERPAGKLSQDAKVTVIKREYTGKDGTKWRARQKSVFELDGKRVRDIRDDDALKNMIRDGQVKLEE